MARQDPFPASLAPSPVASPLSTCSVFCKASSKPKRFARTETFYRANTQALMIANIQLFTMTLRNAFKNELGLLLLL